MGNNLSKNFFYHHKRSIEEIFDFFEIDYGSDLNAFNCLQEFFSIISLFAEDCNYNLNELRTYNGILIIKGSYDGDANDFMLRYGLNGDLIVARVQFIHQRQGNMTKLLRHLEEIKNRYSLNGIIIESVVTDEMRAWCINNNFIEDSNSISMFKRYI